MRIPVDPSAPPPSAATLAAAQAAGIRLLYCPDHTSWMSAAQCGRTAARAQRAEELGDGAELVRLRPCLGCPGIEARQRPVRMRPAMVIPATLPPGTLITMREIARRLQRSDSVTGRVLSEAREAGKLEVVAVDRATLGSGSRSRSGKRQLYDAAQVEAWLGEREREGKAAREAELARWEDADACTVKEFAGTRGLPAYVVSGCVSRARLRGRISPVNPGERPARYSRKGLAMLMAAAAASPRGKRFRIGPGACAGARPLEFTGAQSRTDGRPVAAAGGLRPRPLDSQERAQLPGPDRPASHARPPPAPAPARSLARSDSCSAASAPRPGSRGLPPRAP